jgi:hypothetical protein
LPSLPIGKQAANCTLEGFEISARNEGATLARQNRIPAPEHIESDGGDLHCCGFQNDRRQPFPVRRQDQQIGRSVGGAGVRKWPTQDDARLRFRASQGDWRNRIHRTDDDEATVRMAATNPSENRLDPFNPLLCLEAPDEQEHRGPRRDASRLPEPASCPDPVCT